MHVWFRQYAQQMGMQNVRAILPEQIDILINTSISDTVNQMIKENVGVTSDRVITDNSKVGQLNTLRSLYKTKDIDFDKFTPSKKHTYTPSWEATAHSLGLASENNIPNYLFLVDFSINYKRGDSFYTNFFPVRLIDDIYLADVLNDFVLSPRFRSPILTIYGNRETNADASTFLIHIDKGNYVGDDIELSNGLIPNIFRVAYLSKPAKVSYNEDNGLENVDCDLPEYMHVDIVKHAVDLYHIALQGSLHAAQAAQQQQQQENTRNNYSPANDSNNS